MAAAAVETASPASGKISVIKISLRRGAARLAAPTTVTSTIGAARQSVSHQRRRIPSSTRPAIPSSTRAIWSTRPSVVAMNSPTPLDHIRPTFRTVIPT
jgi:hypothetical protein